jgi:hypothetical protein
MVRMGDCRGRRVHAVQASTHMGINKHTWIKHSTSHSQPVKMNTCNVSPKKNFPFFPPSPIISRTPHHTTPHPPNSSHHTKTYPSYSSPGLVTSTHTDTDTHTHTHTRTHRHTCAYRHTHTDTHTDTHMCIQTHTCAYRHTHVHIDTHRQTDTHTHTPCASHPRLTAGSSAAAAAASACCLSARLPRHPPQQACSTWRPCLGMQYYQAAAC